LFKPFELSLLLVVPKDFKVELRNRTLDFQFLGQFEIERDEQKNPITFQNNYLLGVRTDLTKSGKPELITILPNSLRLKLGRKYYDTRNLADVWQLPGIYAFVSMGGRNEVKTRYIGRASRAVIHRLRRYLAPGSLESTDNVVNRLIFESLDQGKKVLLYFYPEKDTEKRLQALLHPDWNREVPKVKE